MRVYGKAGWNQVDLPIDSITAVSNNGLFREFTVSTASGRISFFGLDNRDAVYNSINQLLIDRQSKSKIGIAQATPTTIMQEASGADELKKYKSLLDDGIITEEEFNAKKKQILGL